MLCEEEIRTKLRQRIPKDRLYNTSEEVFETAVQALRSRCIEIEELAKTHFAGNTGKLLEYLSRQKEKKSRLTNLDVNRIPLSGLVVPFTGRQSAPNGLCPLPTRLDTLTGTVQFFPDYQCESNLSDQDFGPPELVSKFVEFENFSDCVVLKRMRLAGS